MPPPGGWLGPKVSALALGFRVRSEARATEDRASDWYKGRVREENTHDLRLYRRLRSRDAAAFEELFRTYAPAVLGLALRVLGQRGLAEEVVDDTFLALWRAPEVFDPSRGTLRTFVLSLAHHRAVDTVRREERLRKRTANPVNLDPCEGEDIAEDVVEKAWLTERRTQVREALSALPQEQREVVELAYFGGRTQVEIAGLLSVPLGTVKTRTLAAMRKLRRALEEEER